MDFKILTDRLLDNYTKVIEESPLDKIEYVAAKPEIVKQELTRLFLDLEFLIKADLNPFEVFYYASLSHLVFVKIHPFQDGNGRTARLI